MRVLVSGVNGQLGYDVMLELGRRGHEAIGTGSSKAYTGLMLNDPKSYCQLDITDADAVDQLISGIKPDAFVHCAAWTAVDDAEDPINRKRVFDLNAYASGYIAGACRKNNTKLVYISTDYVFGGQGTELLMPDSKNFTPLNVYGQSKLEGEFAVTRNTDRFFIVRTEWVFGSNGHNFVKTMLRLGSTHKTVRVVNDQIGTPTYTVDLARLLVDMIESEQFGYYHATNEGGFISWYDFACEIYRQAGISTSVIPVKTDEYSKLRALRPLNSRLDNSKLTKNGFDLLPDWHDALSRFLKEVRNGTVYF